MKTFIEKVRVVERRICEEKGHFFLYALLLREDNIGLWDLLVCAPWIDGDDSTALRFIVKRLREVITSDEIVNLSHIAIIEHTNPGLEKVWSTVQVEHGLVEIKDTPFFEIPIERALFITSRRPDATHSAQTCQASSISAT